jgi:hypothetical protein
MVGEVLAASAPEPEEKIQPCPKDAAPVPPLLMAKVEVAWTTPFVAKRVPLKAPMAKVVVVALVKSAFVAMSDEEKSVVVVAFVACRVVWKAVVVVEFVPTSVVAKNAVVVAFVAWSVAAKKFVEVPLVMTRAVEKRFVEVAFVVVLFVAMRFVAKELVEVELVLLALVPWSVVVKKEVEVALLVVALRAEKSWKVEKAVDDAYGNIEATVEVAVNVDADALPCTTSAPRKSAEPAASKMLPVVVVAEEPRRKTCAVLVV